MAASFVLCVLLVITKRWHGALTMDFTERVKKIHTSLTPPRISGVLLPFGLVLVQHISVNAQPVEQISHSASVISLSKRQVATMWLK
jgi:hypothetical protein